MVTAVISFVVIYNRNLPKAILNLTNKPNEIFICKCVKSDLILSCHELIILRRFGQKYFNSLNLLFVCQHFMSRIKNVEKTIEIGPKEQKRQNVI